MSPAVYLAGKMSKGCYRETIAPGYRGHSWDDGPLVQPTFICVGPFAVSCDHGDFHGPTRHGSQGWCGAVTGYSRREIYGLCRSALYRADLVFVYITTQDCIGTAWEIGIAQERGIPVVIAFAPGVASSPEDNEYWLACEGAIWVRYDVPEAMLPIVLEQALRRFT